MKLSEAMNLGSGLVPAVRGAGCEKNNGGCALTMAGLAAGVKAGAEGNIWQEAKRTWPWIESTSSLRSCPKCSKRDENYKWIIIHCFDFHIMLMHDMTFEQLVDYVRSIEPAEEIDPELAEQYRAEEEAAAEEGAQIEASGL